MAPRKRKRQKKKQQNDTASVTNTGIEKQTKQTSNELPEPSASRLCDNVGISEGLSTNAKDSENLCDKNVNCDYLSKLSLEVLCNIMKYLHVRDILKLDHQNKKLNQAVIMHLRIKKTLDFSEGELISWISNKLSDSALVYLFKRCNDLQYIYGFNPPFLSKRRQRGAKKLSIPGIIEALSVLKNLKGIEVSDTLVLETLFSYFPHVEILGIFRNRDGCFPVDDFNILRIPENPYITSMHLIGIVVPKLPAMLHLKHLQLRYVHFINPHPFKDFAVPMLRTFVMANCAGPFNVLKYVPLIAGLAAARSLQRMELIRVPFLGDLLHHVVEESQRIHRFKNLHTMKFGACKHVIVMDVGFLAIASAENLEEMYLQASLTKDNLFIALKMAIVKFPMFERLSLGYVEPFQESANWTNQDLVIQGLANVTESPSTITDVGLAAVGECFTELKFLEIYNSPHLLKPTTWISPDGNSYCCLREIVLRRCHSIRLQDFCEFIPLLPVLEAIHLELMFKEPPKGCSRVGLSAGTGFGMSPMSSALIPEAAVPPNIAVPNQNGVNNNGVPDNVAVPNQNGVINNGLPNENSNNNSNVSNQISSNNDGNVNTEEASTSNHGNQNNAVSTNQNENDSLNNNCSGDQNSDTSSSQVSQHIPHNSISEKRSIDMRDSLPSTSSVCINCQETFEVDTDENASHLNLEITDSIHLSNTSPSTSDTKENCSETEPNNIIENLSDFNMPILNSSHHAHSFCHNSVKRGKSIVHVSDDNKISKCNNVNTENPTHSATSESSTDQTKDLEKESNFCDGINKEFCTSVLMQGSHTKHIDEKNHDFCNLKNNCTLQEEKHVNSKDGHCKETDLTDKLTENKVHGVNIKLSEEHARKAENNLDSSGAGNKEIVSEESNTTVPKEEVLGTSSDYSKNISKDVESGTSTIRTRSGKSLYGKKKGLVRKGQNQGQELVTDQNKCQGQSTTSDIGQCQGQPMEFTSSQNTPILPDSSKEGLGPIGSDSFNSSSKKNKDKLNHECIEKSNTNSNKRTSNDIDFVPSTFLFENESKQTESVENTYVPPLTRSQIRNQGKENEGTNVYRKRKNTSFDGTDLPHKKIKSRTSQAETKVMADRWCQVNVNDIRRFSSTGKSENQNTCGSSGYTKLVQKRKSRPVMCTKGTSTSDPVMEDDHIQVLTLRSKSLLCITLNMVGITDLVVEDCPKLDKISGHACRVLKNVSVGNATKLSKVNFTQCKKLDEVGMVKQIGELRSQKNRVVFLRPMNHFNGTKMERELFSGKFVDYNICVVYDMSAEPLETLYNRVRVQSWQVLLSAMNAELLKNYGYKERVYSVSDKYPWNRYIYRQAGYSNNSSRWELITDIPWLRPLFEGHDIDLKGQGSNNPDDGRAGVYCPGAKGHNSIDDCITECLPNIVDGLSVGMPLCLYSVIVYVNLCDIQGTPAFDPYV